MKRISVVLLSFVVSIVASYAQCAMCKASLETKVGDADILEVSHDSGIHSCSSVTPY